MERAGNEHWARAVVVSPGPFGMTCNGVVTRSNQCAVRTPSCSTVGVGVACPWVSWAAWCDSTKQPTTPNQLCWRRPSPAPDYARAVVAYPDPWLRTQMVALPGLARADTFTLDDRFGWPCSVQTRWHSRRRCGDAAHLGTSRRGFMANMGLHFF